MINTGHQRRADLVVCVCVCVCVHVRVCVKRCVCVNDPNEMSWRCSHPGESDLPASHITIGKSASPFFIVVSEDGGF
jgi:hypothetical protein